MKTDIHLMSDGRRCLAFFHTRDRVSLYSVTRNGAVHYRFNGNLEEGRTEWDYFVRNGYQRVIDKELGEKIRKAVHSRVDGLNTRKVV